MPGSPCTRLIDFNTPECSGSSCLIRLIRVPLAFDFRYVRTSDVCFAFQAFQRLSPTDVFGYCNACFAAYALCLLSRAGVWDVWCLLYFASVQLTFVLQVRGVGVGCEAPHFQSILRILRVVLIPPDISMNLHIRPFRVGRCYGIPYIPL